MEVKKKEVKEVIREEGEEVERILVKRVIRGRRVEDYRSIRQRGYRREIEKIKEVDGRQKGEKSNDRWRLQCKDRRIRGKGRSRGRKPRQKFQGQKSK